MSKDHEKLRTTYRLRVMFKRRSVLGKNQEQNKRKKINFEPETKDYKDTEISSNKVTPSPKFKQRNFLGYSTSNSTCSEGAAVEDSVKQIGIEIGNETKSLDNKDVVKHGQLKRDDTPVTGSSTDDSTNEFEVVKGPVHLSNIRTTILTDYQPDICKDYQKTGYCGYGDSCKFLHIREDFKGNWEIKKEWEIIQEDEEAKKSETSLKESLNTVQHSLSEVIPSECYICKNTYKFPVVTTCGHYFCSSCFTKRARENSKCPFCGKETHGVAKMATKLRKQIKEQTKSVLELES